MIDLHVHSNKSDGTFSPSDLTAYALEKGLTAFALTDHDTVAGLTEAIEAAKNTSLTVVPGIEFSTAYEEKDVHVLGYDMDYSGEKFMAAMQSFVDARIERNRKMCKKLQEYAHIDITYESLMEKFPGAVVTRAHYAKYLLEQGAVTNIREAFNKYIGDHAPCFIPREKVTPVQAIRLILDAEGIPVLAHPVLYQMSESRLDKLVRLLTQNGLAGIEACYSTYTRGESIQMKSIARQYGLLVTGGSDFHGSIKPDIDLGTGKGNLHVPDSVLEDLYAYKKQIR